MKKRIPIAVLLVVMVLSVCFASNTYAEDDRSYFMSSYHITARVEQNGDMQVEEVIEYSFDGAFNGVYRTLSTKGNEGIEDIKVFVLQDSQLKEFLQDNSESEFSYQLLQESNQLKIKAFMKAKDESKTFVVKYKAKQAATKYQDIAELYWQFTGRNAIDVPVHNYKVVILLPGNLSKEQVKVFAHGPLSGNSSINEDGTVLLSINKLLPKNMVEARVLFPVENLNNSARIVDKAMLNEIMQEEAAAAEKANRQRAVDRMMVAMALIFAFIQLFMIILIYFKYDKEYKSNFSGLYFRELPYDYSPAVMAVLWNFGAVTAKEITATLMDLVRRRVLELKVENIEKRSLFGDKAEEDYIFKKLPSTEAILTEQEQYLIEWLIDDIGDGSEISLNKLQRHTKTTKNAERFKKSYDAWVGLVKAEAGQYQFFDSSAKSGAGLGILTGMLGIAYGIFTIIKHENILGFLILLLTSFVLIMYSALVKRRSHIGVEHFSKWKAFRKYLTDFSLLKEAEMPAVTLWEHFLVYAISLGVAKEVIKQLKLVFRDEDFNRTGLTYMYYGYYGHGLNHLDSLDHITTSMIKTTESTYTQAMSQLSLSSGSGGGFSGGGGGGGGGGGAGAF